MRCIVTALLSLASCSRRCWRCSLGLCCCWRSSFGRGLSNRRGSLRKYAAHGKQQLTRQIPDKQTVLLEGGCDCKGLLLRGQGWDGVEPLAAAASTPTESMATARPRRLRTGP